ncbi:MAG: GNA1162 family protein [Nitrospirota bacterium]
MTAGHIKGTIFFLLLLFLVSCAHRVESYRDSNMDFSSIKTVAVMPFANLTRETQAPDRVRDVFSTMLLATGAVYVLPPGETARGIARVGIANPATPSVEEVTKLGGVLSANAVITGVVREYGEVRSASAAANVISLSVEMFETQSGRVVWKAATTEGGISIWARMFGGGGEPMDDITRKAVNDLLNDLFK